MSFWSFVDICLIGNHTTSSFLYDFIMLFAIYLKRALLIIKAVWWPIVVNVCVMLVSFGQLSHWQSYHIFFFILNKASIRMSMSLYTCFIDHIRLNKWQDFYKQTFCRTWKIPIDLFDFFVFNNFTEISGKKPDGGYYTCMDVGVKIHSFSKRWYIYSLIFKQLLATSTIYIYKL